MENANGFHPDLGQLAAFDLGQLTSAQSSTIEDHISRCETCRQQLEALPDDPLVELLRACAGMRNSHEVNNNLVDAPVLCGRAVTAVPQRPEIPPALAAHPRYRILGFVGAGGMGAVFKAEHRLMQRVVALKVLGKDLVERPGMVERFRLEVQAAARLSHANIVTAFDAEQAGDLHFLVMEFVEGTSLDRLIEQQGPATVSHACEWVRQTALGLQHAFEHGMVHRDIKPANLLLTPEGQVKILDFGLARFASESGDGSALTQAGSLVGTLDYMAPEQARAANQADIRADIYSLGCTLYFLLAGRPPFAGTALQKLLSHQDQLPSSLTNARNDVPAELLPIMDRMLAKSPEHRYQTPAEVAQALAASEVAGWECHAKDAEVVNELWPGHRPATSPPHHPTTSLSPTHTSRLSWRRWYVLAAAILLFGAASIGVAVWSVMTNRSVPDEAGREPAAEQSMAKTAPAEIPKAEQQRAPTIDPAGNGKTIVTIQRPASENGPSFEQARKRASAWVRENSRGGPTSKVAQDVAELLKYPDVDKGFQFTLGSGLVNSGRPTILTAWGGEFYVFELSAEQARNLTLAPSNMPFKLATQDTALEARGQ